jgi:hypothetical protein
MNARLAVQIAIAILGPAGIWFSQSRNERSRRWAPVIGLTTQPLWLWSAWDAQQFGTFLACVVYTLSWARGFWTYWIRRP